MRIVHRQALSRGTAVAVVEVGNRVLVLGTTEHQVNVLAELDEGELDGHADLTVVAPEPTTLSNPAAGSSPWRARVRAPDPHRRRGRAGTAAPGR